MPSLAGTAHRSVYTYDSHDRMETAKLQPVNAPLLAEAAYAHYPDSPRLHTLTRPLAGGQALVGTWGWDVQSRLDAVQWTRGSAVTASYDYELNTAGRRTLETRHDGTRLRYDYNDRGELDEVRRERVADSSLRPDWSHDYSYNNMGDLTYTYTPDGNGLSYAFQLAGTTGEYQLTNTKPSWRWLRGRANPDALVKVGEATAEREGELWRYRLNLPAIPAPQQVVISAGRPDLQPAPLSQTQVVTFPRIPTARQFNLQGNLASDGVWTYACDAENRLVSQEQAYPGVSGEGAKAVKRLEFVYDGLGRRIAKRVLTGIKSPNGTLQSPGWTFSRETVFIWQDWTLLAELVRMSSGGPLSLRRSYLWGMDVNGTLGGAGGVGGLLWVAEYVPGVTGSNRQLAPWYDGNGNVMGWLENDGTQPLPLHRLEYDAFGKLLVEDEVRVVRNQKQRDLGVGAEWLERPPFAFSTKYEDSESGMLYYGYRYYAPEMGRWISRDPIEERGGINLYGMVGNDPVNRWDYLGLCKCGPDATDWFMLELMKVYLSHINLPSSEKGPIDGALFLLRNGVNIDAMPAPSKELLEGCAGEGCKDTYMLLDKCVSKWTMNNILYGFVSKMMKVPPGIRNDGAEINNLAKGQGLEGLNQKGAYAAGSRAAGPYLDPSRSITPYELKKEMSQYLDLIEKLPCKPCGKKLPTNTPGKKYSNSKPILSGGM
ncbi:RHS repeat-associated core domain-containing protein [Prosthecobacter sp. SYSU 5D2]|uniref:RHS repeat-associated core domain-containing protein n=1 Tax=Prosthecobacter sp. SYSU 5D2 TaxID=3134134 RepID=UPI0031FE9B87